MIDRDPDLDRQEIRLPDGRRLVYYRFPDRGEAGGEPPATPGRGAVSGAGEHGAGGGPPPRKGG
jgi:hypothetical protein